ncbi:MAG: hypothetical protein QF805_15655 [Pirellulaceae bacterium]|nr:hypothetical protein [Pirellulaceae bacterium]
MFHVLSSHNDTLRRELYGVVGFRECPPIALPENYRARKLTNPDAPQINNVIELELKKGEAKVLATPLLYASVDRYDPDKGGSFFKYLKFALMVVRAKDDCFEPIVKDGELELLSPRETPDYFRQIGRNTRYIIHPDEILADNFVWMVRGKKELSNPEIVEKMSRLFKQEQQEQDEP